MTLALRPRLIRKNREMVKAQEMLLVRGSFSCEKICDNENTFFIEAVFQKFSTSSAWKPLPC